ncbi:MAG: prolyl oligopeptidase family serine peptidase [Gammaproteobacteria bacterium]|nr:prolyl oligopeptidase family serine peptidase [Gammaproteobacteria bacterium]
MTKTVWPYGTWHSKVNAKMATSSHVSHSELMEDSGNLYYLELRPNEGGRTTIMRRSIDGSIREVTHSPFNVRSMVHEYGGAAYTVHNDTVYFVNKDDQDIYVLDLQTESPATRLTNSGKAIRYANLVVDLVRQRIACVRESHGKKEVVNELVTLDLTNGNELILHSGHDFYASPQFCPCQGKMAFLGWDLPNMPWDGCKLYIADLSRGGDIAQTVVVAGGKEESVLQPCWISKDELLFVSDRNGFWNIYRWINGKTEVVFEDKAEYGFPLWVLHMRSLVLLDKQTFVAVRIDEQGVDLVFGDLAQKTWRRLGTSNYTSISSPVAFNKGIAFIASFADALPSIVTVADLHTIHCETLVCSGELALPQETISIGHQICYENDQGQVVHANYYAPKNDEFTALDSDLPPLVVMSHGGPTGQSNVSFSFKVQYFTSRGWAVLDVNYGGSTGYGREYRNRLIGKWGIVDVADCVAGVQHLVELGLADENRVAIRGGSAGGYTTLRALNTTNVFKVGASYYGIGDMRALAEDTHKFESEYLSNLIPPELLDERSPINSLENFDSPVIFYQGQEDAVVPPNQTQSMYDALAKRGITTAMFLFEGEGHGFRRAESNQIALESELTFFSRVLQIELHEVSPHCLDSANLQNPTW